MIRLRLSWQRALFAGSVVAAAALSAPPASAQYVHCPAGYYYSYPYGCVPISPAYGDIYGDPDPDYDVGPPVYDSFGYGFGYGGGRGYGGGHGYGGHGGGTHGGGGHGGGGGFGGGHGGGGHGGGHH